MLDDHGIGDCVISPLDGNYYQADARLAFERAADRDLQPHAWIRTTCERRCLNPAHLIVHQPIFINYPPGVCVYCGFPAGTKDHLVPRPWTGETRRNSVAVVPACGDCNSRIGDRHSVNIDDRRRGAQASLRKRHRMILEAPEWTDEQLAEFGPTLRGHIESKAREREAIKSRLSWPDDPFYDLRAWQKSGVDDPVALGVIDPPVRIGHQEAKAA